MDLEIKKQYWENYYKLHRVEDIPSTFALYISKYLQSNKYLIDLGCGNARDSRYFASLAVKTVGIDIVENEIDFLNSKYKSDMLDFKVDNMGNMIINDMFDYIYSRFSLHAINQDDQTHLFKWIENHLNLNGLLFIECRSNKDNMFNNGIQISENENITDHYRRYLDFNQLLNILKNKGFEIIESLESDGLSKKDNDDPVLIRIVAKQIN